MPETTATQRCREQPDKNAIRPFPKLSVPEAELTELRRRINETRWPERETVTDATQGVQLATTRALASYWAKEYDWRKVEARLNALPQFITEIDGLDIHYVHVRSKHENARLFPGSRRHPVSQRMRRSLTSVCSPYIKRESPTGSKWVCGRRRYTESQIHPSAWRLISLIMTHAAMR